MCLVSKIQIFSWWEIENDFTNKIKNTTEKKRNKRVGKTKGKENVLIMQIKKSILKNVYRFYYE